MSEANVDRLLARAREQLGRRATPDDLAGVLARGGLVIDTRSAAQRERDGELDGAIVVERNALEWRLDPTCPYKLPELHSVDQPIVIVCDEGYGSTFAALSVRQLGLQDVTDLAGGFKAIIEARRS
jgi:rhodanese-related sulfurtransferase